MPITVFPPAATTTASSYKGLWSSSGTYAIGDAVVYNGALYRATASSSPGGPSTISDGLSTATTKPSWLLDGTNAANTRGSTGTNIGSNGALYRNASATDPVDLTIGATLLSVGDGFNVFVGGAWGNSTTAVNTNSLYVSVTPSSWGVFYNDGNATTTVANGSHTISANQAVSVRLQLTTAGLLNVFGTVAGTTTQWATNAAIPSGLIKDGRQGVRGITTGQWNYTNFSALAQGGFPAGSFVLDLQGAGSKASGRTVIPSTSLTSTWKAITIATGSAGFSRVSGVICASGQPGLGFTCTADATKAVTTGVYGNGSNSSNQSFAALDATTSLGAIIMWNAGSQGSTGQMVIRNLKYDPSTGNITFEAITGISTFSTTSTNLATDAFSNFVAWNMD